MVELIELGPDDARALARFLERKGDRATFATGTQSVTVTIIELTRLVAEYGRAFTDALCVTPDA